MNDDFDIREENISKDEKEFENALRPLRFDDFNGQQNVVENLRVFVEAAKYRGEPLDHTLLYGPPGLGKTTLSNIIANELGVGFKITSGPVLDKPGDLAGILTSLEPNDVLFIDEIHRLQPVVEEYLYSAMEDYRIDIMIDKGPSARSIQIDLNPFTLIGATTRSGMLTAPLRARFCSQRNQPPEPWYAAHSERTAAACSRLCTGERQRHYHHRYSAIIAERTEHRLVRTGRNRQ